MAVAFALYIDETLQVDLTDPHTTTILAEPVTVYPSCAHFELSTEASILSATRMIQRDKTHCHALVCLWTWYRGITYSASTVEKLQKEAEAKGVVALCPTTYASPSPSLHGAICE